MTGYEDRLVAFVDVLGWSYAVRRSGTDAQGLAWFAELLQGMEQQAAGSRQFSSTFPEDIPLPGTVRDFQATQFSDCLVLSVPFDAPYAMSSMEQWLGQLCIIAAQNGFLLRGGLVRGPLLHKERVVLGPAMLDAYDLERCVAVYPRIIADASIFQEAFPSPSWIKDADGQLFFDYLRAFGVIRNLYKRVICEGLINATDARVIEKYVWARDYFESLDPTTRGYDLAPIVIEVAGQLWAYGPSQWPTPRKRA